MIITATGYLNTGSTGNHGKESMNEICMYNGLGKYKRVLDQKNEFQKLILREADRKAGREGGFNVGV